MKYHNSKITTPDGTFDSKHELQRWGELKIMERAGIIEQLKRQVRFDLVPAQPRDGLIPAERGVSYIADFTYLKNGELVVEDAKGYKTAEYIIKRKLMRWIHKVVIKEV